MMAKHLAPLTSDSDKPPAGYSITTAPEIEMSGYTWLRVQVAGDRALFVRQDGPREGPGVWLRLTLDGSLEMEPVTKPWETWV
jgi:hypothetical protein